jgi:hypothetical protein
VLLLPIESVAQSILSCLFPAFLKDENKLLNCFVFIETVNTFLSNELTKKKTLILTPATKKQKKF